MIYPMFDKYGHFLKMHLVVYWKDIAPGLIVAEKLYGLLTIILTKWKYDRGNSDETLILVLTINHPMYQKIIQSP